MFCILLPLHSLPPPLLVIIVALHVSVLDVLPLSLFVCQLLDRMSESPTQMYPRTPLFIESQILLDVVSKALSPVLNYAMSQDLSDPYISKAKALTKTVPRKMVFLRNTVLNGC